jgi:pSer/pThr/pTyr-binding forkhead associated (FHA) protein
VAPLDKPVVSIGSVQGNDIVINDPSVSRKHIGIRKVDGGYEVADFGSTNGVFVNGERCPKKQLSIGDVIRVGNIEMVFRV